MNRRAKIAFITIAVADLQRSLDFYTQVFGFPSKGIQEGYDDHFVFELEDDFTLAVFRRDDFLPLTANPAETVNSAGFMLSYAAPSREDVDEIVDTAISAGGTRIGEPVDEDWGYSVRFGDPDGHPWEVVAFNG